MSVQAPTDLWGEPITTREPPPPADGKRKSTRPNGYAAQPGSGPKGETCGSCAHCVWKEMAKSYLKCGKVRATWTGGPGTDIRARAPACSFWERPVDGCAAGENPLYPCVFSDDRRFRYSLENAWVWNNAPGWQPKRIMWIGLNPSTADERKLDPTLKRIEAFSRLWGFEAFVMTNLFAFRATDPKVMFAASDPIGPDNDRHLLETAARCGKIVAAWGAGQTAGQFLARASHMRSLLAPFADRLCCVGTTQDGFPRHPLYVRGDTPPTQFKP